MLDTVEIQNFKAIPKVSLNLSPLTAFVGYNGVGKSSLLEALEMFQAIVSEDLGAAIGHWREFEHIYYKGTSKESQFFEKDGKELGYAPMRFGVGGTLGGENMQCSTSLAQFANGKKYLYFVAEDIQIGDGISSRSANSRVSNSGSKPIEIGFQTVLIDPQKSILSLSTKFKHYAQSWQFLSMNTFLMGDPYPQAKTQGVIKLSKDGRNIAEYLFAIREVNLDAYNGILETLQYVLPYASDLQASITTEIERMVYLQMSEQDFKLPGWVLSTGTLKILALLAVFRNPEPSPLIVIEELENGLDPRTIHLVVEEIRNYLDAVKGQVLITTHSPYLLDLLHISQIVLVERIDGKVVFSRPGEDAEVKEWSKTFAPGKLYTMGNFNKP